MPHAIDFAIIAIYLAGIVGLGWWLSRRQRGLRDYFLSGKDVAWWALAASIVATETSVISFISVPAFAYAANARGEGGNFTFLQLAAGFMLGRVIIILLFLPSYFRGELFTVYQVLDRRFGERVRRLAAALFLLTRTLGDGVRLYATALVLMAMAGVSLKSWGGVSCVIAIGVVMIVVTWMGGVSAVIWTEVAQLAIYILGALAAMLILLDRIPGGWSEVAAAGAATDHFRVFDFTFDIARGYTFWSGLAGGAFLTTATHGTDQFMVQRYLCSRGPRQAARALLASGVMIMAQFIIFLLIGVMLWTFYRTAPLPAEVAANADRIFPHFIATELPPGVLGLVAAALIAAAMSSSLNALASTMITDFYKPLLAPGREESHYLKVARHMTLAWGAAQIAAALGAMQVEQRVVDAALAIASFTSGPMLGIFFLGALTRRTSEWGALSGVAAGIAVMIFVWLRLNVSWQWYALFGAAITFAIGYGASLLFDRPVEQARHAAD